MLRSPTVFAGVGVNCTLTMMDVYADGWNGAVFTLGNLVSTTLETGAAEKYYFTIPVPSASSPPVPPSSPQLFKDVHSPSESCDHIRSLSDCSAAAEALGFDDTSPTDDYLFDAPTYLPGCYYYAGSSDQSGRHDQAIARNTLHASADNPHHHHRH